MERRKITQSLELQSENMTAHKIKTPQCKASKKEPAFKRLGIKNMAWPIVKTTI